MRKQLLEKRDKMIIRFWQTKNYSMKEIGKVFNLSTQRIYQVIKNAMEKEQK